MWVLTMCVYAPSIGFNTLVLHGLVWFPLLVTFWSGIGKNNLHGQICGHEQSIYS